jgi:hypothetical protein
MPTRTLRATLVLCLVFLAAANLLASRETTRLYFARKLAAIDSVHNANLVYVGASQLDDHDDPIALNRGATLGNLTLTPVNAALGNSSPADQALLFQEAVRANPNLHTLVIGFIDFQMTTEFHFTPFQLLGNHLIAVDPRFPIADVDTIYQYNPVESLELRALRALPAIAYRSNTWQRVEVLRRSFGGTGLPHEASNQWGRAADFADTFDASRRTFDADSARFLAGPAVFAPSYQHIFDLAAQHHMHIVLVVMPVPPLHREVLYARPAWHAYLTRLQQMCAQRGYTLLDGSAWVDSPFKFDDIVHLNRAGVADFQFRLGRDIATGAD